MRQNDNVFDLFEGLSETEAEEVKRYIFPVLNVLRKLARHELELPKKGDSTMPYVSKDGTELKPPPVVGEVTRLGTELKVLLRELQTIEARAAGALRDATGSTAAEAHTALMAEVAQQHEKINATLEKLMQEGV